MTEKKELSIVVLCYKSGELARILVKELTQKLEKLPVSWELVLVGNYFPADNDPTPVILKEIAGSDSERIKVVAEKKQGMMGWDVRKGLEAATGDYLAFIDGDGQMPLDDLITIFDKIKTQNLDIVKTYRHHRHDGLKRRIISSIYNNIFQVMFPGYPVHDVNSKPKIFTRAAYEKLDLTSDDWFVDAEIIIKARRHKMNMAEVPTVFLKNVRRKSFVKNSAIFEFLKNIILARINEFRVNKTDK